MFGKIVKYMGEVRNETAKVIWPTRPELQGSAVIVVMMSLLLAVFVFVIDFLLNNVLKVVF